MRIFSLLPLMLFVTGFVGAQASSFSLNFQTLQLNEQVLNFFNGGTGSLASGPGPNFGITFSPDLQVQGTFIKQGFLTSSSSTMNVQAGFSGIFSFMVPLTCPERRLPYTPAFLGQVIS